MKNRLAVFLFMLGILLIQETTAQKKKIYNPRANANEQISDAINKARIEKKHVLVMVGGNWCSWCVKFDKFVTGDYAVSEYLDQHYILVHVNYSKENHNYRTLQELGFPQRFGFPVFVVLDEKGQRLHTQNSVYLEKDGGYDEEAVLNFLKHWSNDALNPANYEKDKN
ncbi:thioredoxin family protein [Aureibacter tunicatorum]|uniref:Thioredoxin-related protein n=1 Tax=Aureibacter tunicatorum TaxID=866807 RepID=A0AAE3XK22_9BACT|nr:thioredoxin family protein [Aureibacter tunicatorum]MDR6237360.1 thioredoxin-related protein [Aureibacter tunicatorum]BDD06351.1 hypothetical protein AUTU_38340 [Aureibacter tunicatorum]